MIKIGIDSFAAATIDPDTFIFLDLPPEFKTNLPIYWNC